MITKLINKFSYSDFGNKLINRLIEIKVNNPSAPMGLPLYPTGDHPLVYSPEAILFYLECAPVATAINKITMELSSIRPILYNKKTSEFIEDHPVLDLLAAPDADYTYKEFMESLTTFFLVTGNAYIRSVGYIKAPPKTLRVCPSQAATIVVDFDGYAKNITARILAMIDTFDRNEVKEGNQIIFRYYAGEFKELYHIRTFNPWVGSNMAYGISPLNHVFYEMRQYVDSAKYNLSALQRGSRIGGLFTLKGRMLTSEQRARLEEQINRAMTGPNNAGRNILLDDSVDFQDLIKNSRDMDYSIMKTQVTMAIYNALKIPLPLINPEHMTLANMDAAKLLLYDNAVLPLARRIYEELTNFLMPRYGKDGENLILTFNEDEIPALEPRKNEQINLKKLSGIFSTNELRAEYGAEPIDGGNSVLGASTLVPIAEDNSGTFKVDDLEPPEPNPAVEVGQKPEDGKNPIKEEEDLEQEKPEAVPKEKFMSTLKMQVNKDGSPRFTDEEISELVNKHYAG